MSSSDTPREAHLLTLIVRALYWLDESLQAELEAGGVGRLSRSQSMILANLTLGVDRPSEIARNLGLSRQAVHQTLGEMAAAGLVDMIDDPEDGRAKKVVFSGKPQQNFIRDAALAAFPRIEQELARRIGAQQVEDLKAALSKDWGEPLRRPST